MKYLPENASENIFVMPYALLAEGVHNVIARRKEELVTWVMYALAFAVAMVDVMTFSSAISGEWGLLIFMTLVRVVLYVICLFAVLGYATSLEIDEARYLDEYYGY
jgi:hypothetical protein